MQGARPHVYATRLGSLALAGRVWPSGASARSTSCRTTCTTGAETWLCRYVKLRARQLLRLAVRAQVVQRTVPSSCARCTAVDGARWLIRCRGVGWPYLSPRLLPRCAARPPAAQAERQPRRRHALRRAVPLSHARLACQVHGLRHVSRLGGLGSQPMRVGWLMGRRCLRET
jgi:hypothetical protein